MYSEEPATGSGTDSLIAVGNLESDLVLHGAGKHCILGELIGQSVKEALKEALDKQCSMNPTRQASMIWQGKRYGITTEKLYENYQKTAANKSVSFEIFNTHLGKITTDNESVGYVVSLYHLIDQHRWGMLSADTLNSVGLTLLNKYREKYSLALLQPKNTLNYKELLTEIKKTVIEITINLI